MAKWKEEKEGQEGRESKSHSDGLEIVSIGSLYQGAWDKKYWSSSRGKDRYPYPVGYNAVRAQNGSIYKMEIHEGLTGPLFMITSDGQSCSGQTPDIAWEKFQKTGCPRLKIWHGKRFSCKIDGVEFFGFKNQFVQRLLREMVANVKGASEQCSNSSSFCIKASTMESHGHHPNVCMHPDLLSYLPRLPKGKRSPKCEILKGESVNSVGTKRTINQIETSDARSPISRKVKQTNGQQGLLVAQSTLKERINEKSSPKALPALFHIDPSSEDIKEHSTNNDCVKSLGSNDLMREKEISDKSTMSIKIANLHVELPRLQNTDLDKTTETEDKAEDSNAPKDSLDINSDNLIAPDTMDLLPGIDSPPEQETGAFDSSTCSEKSDFDSVGHEMAKLMMTVLLPQAVPLLKTFSRKKKGNLRPSNIILPTGLKFQHDNTDTRDYVDVASSAVLPFAKSNLEDQKMQMQDIDLGPIILDSFDEHKHENLAGNSTGPENMVEAAEVNLYKGWSNPKIQEEVPAVHVKDQPVRCVEVPGSDGAETGFAKVPSSTQFQTKVYHRRKVSKRVLSIKDYNGPLSESIVCQDSGNVSAIENFSKREDAISSDICQAFDEVCNMDSYCMDHGTWSQHLKLYQATTNCTDAPDVPVTIENQELVSVPRASSLEEEYHIRSRVDAQGMNDLNDHNHSALSQNEWENRSDDNTSNTRPIIADSFFKLCSNLELYSELQEVFQIVGCYFNLMPVSSLLLKEQGDEIYICVSCGLLTDMTGSLLVYKVSLSEQKPGHPSFLGYTSITLPFSRDKYAREIALQGCGLQFIPDGQNLALLGSIRTPYCSKGRLDCICSKCGSDCSEDNTVKIVQIRPGYASVMTKLKTDEHLQCILVCENNHLVAAGQSGRLHVFTMNLAWSAQTEEKFIVPAGHCEPIVEMKSVPNFASLVAGHNGRGEFVVWDISKRLVVSSYFAPCCLVDQFLAFSSISWPSTFRYGDVEGHIAAAIKNSFLKQAEDNSCLQGDGEDLVIWLLLSTTCNDEAQQDHISGQNPTHPVRTWKLALLMKGSLILGNSLDPRTAAVGASNGYGIGGTVDGLVYVWELSTGIRLGNLHHFKGHSVSCIATDESKSGVLAVAADDGRVLLYLRNKTSPR